MPPWTIKINLFLVWGLHKITNRAQFANDKWNRPPVRIVELHLQTHRPNLPLQTTTTNQREAFKTSSARETGKLFESSLPQQSWYKISTANTHRNTRKDGNNSIIRFRVCPYVSKRKTLLLSAVCEWKSSEISGRVRCASTNPIHPEAGQGEITSYAITLYVLNYAPEQSYQFWMYNTNTAFIIQSEWLQIILL